MTPPETPVVSGLADAVRTKLQDAPAPLKLAEVMKGIPKPRKVKKSDWDAEARQVLDEEVRLARAYAYPSGKKGELRYWSRDEKQLLRDKAAEFTSTPRPLPALKKRLGEEVKGTDGAFVEAVVRELVGADRLFEHPAKTKRGGPLFGATPPPPPLPVLEQTTHKKAMNNLVTACQRLLTAAGVPAEELFRALHRRLSEPAPGTTAPAAPAEAPAPEPAGSALEELILKAVANAPVVSLADLRREMPQEYRGQAFDEAVLRLADEQRVIVSQDADPSRFSDAERADYVQDGAAVFTTVSKWS